MFKNWLFKNTTRLDKWMCYKFWTLPLISWDELKTPQPWGPESSVLESESLPLYTHGISSSQAQDWQKGRRSFFHIKGQSHWGLCFGRWSGQICLLLRMAGTWIGQSHLKKHSPAWVRQSCREVRLCVRHQGQGAGCRRRNLIFLLVGFGAWW